MAPKLQYPEYKSYTLKDSVSWCNYVHGWNSAINAMRAMQEKKDGA